jgi:RNA polymerase sigma factor (sigma-70 family)
VSESNLHEPVRQHSFHTTRWSVVLAAQEKSGRNASDALQALCEQYWPPLYAYVRHRGNSEHDAQDLTQGFFARLLEKGWLSAADPTRGRFRTFLLMSVKRFLANEWDRSKAQKRGGSVTIVSMPDADQISIPDSSAMTAETLFERRWALTLLQSVMARLGNEYENQGRSMQYVVLKSCLTAEREKIDYASLASALGMEQASVRSAVHRMRKRFREIFRDEVAGTVANGDDVDDEMRAIITSLGAAP